MTIEQIIKQILKHEGGYINHPDDKGGPTNFGITQKTLTNYLSRHASIEDVKSLTRKEAFDIYEQHYYHYPRIDQLPIQTQPLMVDMAVNHGPRRAIKILQQELQHGGYNVGQIDSIIGSKTITATRLACADHGREFINYLINRRLQFYRDIVNNNPSQSVFLNGWIARAESYRPINSSARV